MAVIGAACLLLAAGCAGSGGATEPAAAGDLTAGMVGVQDAGEPVRGGIAAFGSHAEPRSLDPAVTIAAGTTGGVEMLNIYDSLMRYDSDAGAFVPQLAEAIDHDPGYTTWTVTLRDGVTFSDGSVLDAAAVRASQERYAAAPAPEAGVWTRSVAGIDTPDPHTVVYRLTEGWPEFPSLLASGPGMIVGAGADGPDGSFTPIGAGPFALSEWANGDHMLLTAREDYWGGAPNLDGLRFVYMKDTQTRKETLLNGGLDLAVIGLPDDIDEVLDRGFAGYMSLPAAGNVGIINAAPGHAGADPRLRRAMALAVDPAVVMQRSFGDGSLGDTAIFPASSRWATTTRGVTPDPEEAKRLVAEAKADGFDGAVTVVEAPGQRQMQRALAVKTQLDSVGFDARMVQAATVSDQIRMVAKDGDYDISSWGMNYRESSPFLKLYETMHSDGSQTYGMYTSDAMDSLIDAFQAEPDHAEKVRILDRIQEQVNTDVPYLVYSAFPEFIAWREGVHGVTGSSNSMVLFGDAWEEQG